MGSWAPLVVVSLVGGCGLSGDPAPIGSWDGSTPIGTVSAPPEDEPPPEPDPTCDVETPVTLFVSPDDSNSMSSPVQAREAVLANRWPGGVAIRTWEFLNYYAWDYPAPEPGDLAVDLQLIEGEADGDYVLQVGITSAAPVDRAPMNLVFSVDASGSMEGPSIQLAKDVMDTVSAQLVAGDVVSIVTWDTSNNIRLAGHVVDGPSDPDVASAISGIRTGGATDLAGGLAVGYQLADDGFAADRINRVILISDGGANVGQTDEDVIGRHAGGEDEDGVYLVGVGVGAPGRYNDGLMDVVTDLGRGAAVFVPSSAEAEGMFGDRFLETVGVAARDVQIRYDLPPGFEVVRFSGEEISTVADEVRPQHLAPDDTIVLHQTLHACGGPAPDEALFGVTVEWRDAVTFAPRETGRTATLGELLAGDHALLAKGAAVFAYAEALKGLGTTVSEARDAWTVASELNPGDPDLAEIQTVLDRL